MSQVFPTCLAPLNISGFLSFLFFHFFNSSILYLYILHHLLLLYVKSSQKSNDFCELCHIFKTSLTSDYNGLFKLTSASSIKLYFFKFVFYTIFYFFLLSNMAKNSLKCLFCVFKAHCFVRFRPRC